MRDRDRPKAQRRAEKAQPDAEKAEPTEENPAGNQLLARLHPSTLAFLVPRFWFRAGRQATHRRKQQAVLRLKGVMKRANQRGCGRKNYDTQPPKRKCKAGSVMRKFNEFTVAAAGSGENEDRKMAAQAILTKEQLRNLSSSSLGPERGALVVGNIFFRLFLH